MKFNKVNAWLMALSITATTVGVNGVCVQAEPSQSGIETAVDEEIVTVNQDTEYIDGTIIKKEAFQNRYEINRVVLASGITKIGRHAFFHCTSLKSVVVLSTVEEIEAGAFQDCTSLEYMDLSKTKITRISEETFRGCKNLKQVVLPKTITRIEANSFLGCGALESINLSALKELKRIGSGAFSNCISLKELTLPEQVSQIGGGAFLNCKGLESITIPGKVSDLGLSVLEGANHVTIKGVMNSYGYDYAMKKGLSFQAISDEIMVSDIQMKGELVKNQENIKKLRVKQEEVISLGVEVTPGNATDASWVWEIEKPEILSIDVNGKLTARKRGFTGVTLRAIGGVNKRDYLEVSVV